MKSAINFFKGIGNILGIIGIALLLALIIFPEALLKFFGWTWSEIVLMNQIGTPMLLEIITLIMCGIAIGIWLLLKLFKSHKKPFLFTDNSKDTSQIEIESYSDNKVYVRANPETGNIITVRKNPESCSIRVESSVVTHNEQGSLVQQKRTAFVRMQTAVAEALIAKGQLKVDKQLPVKDKIVVKESFEPFYESQQPKVNLINGEIVTYESKPVYKVIYFQSGEQASDEFIADYVTRLAKEQQSSLEIEEIPEEMLNQFTVQDRTKTV